MKTDELYKQKGELTWQMQIAQARLQQIDAELVKITNQDLKKEDGTA